MNSNVAKQCGFTLLELIVVITLVTILAAIAIPRFVNLGSHAEDKSTLALAASLSATSAANFAKRSTNPTGGAAINNCTQVANILAGGLPSGYTLTGGNINPGEAKQCTLTRVTGQNATFTAMGIA